MTDVSPSVGMYAVPQRAAMVDPFLVTDGALVSNAMTSPFAPPMAASVVSCVPVQVKWSLVWRLAPAALAATRSLHAPVVLSQPNAQGVPVPSVPAEVQVSGDPVFQRGNPQLGQARRLARRQQLAGNVHERLAAPQGQGGPQLQRGPVPLALPGGGVAHAAQGVEPQQVQLAGTGLDKVAGVTGPDPRLPGLAKRLPEPLDVVLQGDPRRAGRGTVPDQLSELISGHDLARADEQHRQHGALLALRDRQYRVTGPDDKRPKQTELHPCLPTGARVPPGA